ncbi:hypothetical protein BEWA_003360 [Theileria equi strain WA]|uniref:Uncharacterized protein n=1 Tax=Theileria equi strain WA TaxID=1537102 RepID=L0B0C2_THEEQ|nr:hypothetical protein BEWA_003360 [Theileria equi strain WA]AFZ80928.1 hypothetical protein BEWA_003360 [Theileria equi strain WA]|eukprot:XP_004830594.1 hypothetical protein BEWA_003360 [Theileria equi strain WA]
MILKNIFIDSYICPLEGAETKLELREQHAREFMASELDHLSAADLGSRVSLQLTGEVVTGAITSLFPQNRMLIIETFNNTNPDQLNDDIRHMYPYAKIATMKSGGDFPYLTRPDELFIFVQVFLNNLKSDCTKSESPDTQEASTVANLRSIDLNYDSENSVISGY